MEEALRAETAPTVEGEGRRLMLGARFAGDVCSMVQGVCTRARVRASRLTPDNRYLVAR